MDQDLHLKLTVRLYTDDAGRCFGPGIATLLHRVEEHHSLRAAAKSMEMAYSKAWRIIRTAERVFGCKMLESTIGGQGGGGAVLTAQAHRDMGTLCRELGIETVAVGEKMKALTETDPEAQWFAGVEEAMPAVRARFTPGTAVLVKASHAMHFENIVKELEKE